MRELVGGEGLLRAVDDSRIVVFRQFRRAADARRSERYWPAELGRAGLHETAPTDSRRLCFTRHY